MADEITEEREAFPTQSTAEASLSGVDALVDLQIIGVGELLAALGAGEGLFSGVDPLVALQSAQLRKRSSTADTAEHPLLSVDALVKPQLPRVAEALSTHAAVPRLLSTSAGLVRRVLLPT